MTKFINTSRLLVYLGAWMVVITIHFSFLFFIYRLSLPEALLDSLAFNLLYCLIGIGIWLVVEFSGIALRTTGEAWVQYLTLCVLSVFLWILGAYAFLGWVLEGNEGYLLFLEETRGPRALSGVFFYIILVSVFYLAISTRELQQKREREGLLVSQLREAELNMLKTQIRPHFLFNSLNSISALTLSDPARAREMVIKLSDFMRYSLTFQGEGMSTLDRELYHIKLYLDIEKTRFGDKLSVRFDICENCGEWPLPSMILQPLIENAIKYGVYEASQPVQLEVIATRLSTALVQLTIRNPVDEDVSLPKGTGTGLENTRKRLETVYGRPGLLFTRLENNIFTTQISFPFHAEDQSTHRG